MKRKYAYVFTIGSTLQWSSETEESLLKRVDAVDKVETQAFIWDASPGSFFKLSTGEMVFQIA